MQKQQTINLLSIVTFYKSRWPAMLAEENNTHTFRAHQTRPDASQECFPDIFFSTSRSFCLARNFLFHWISINTTPWAHVIIEVVKDTKREKNENANLMNSFTLTQRRIFN
ncbi:CLUMA_CG006061, isoform A [Clunio marinus]|uniref:CLUMA_CG006061, isoform A n=1 Tax=Clunio marinus TaxID=568069 RepID=A0A1J1HWJ9_9DIPT|nr:CLUMA_CG006061, isoform A [Clunio marinus]